MHLHKSIIEGKFAVGIKKTPRVFVLIPAVLLLLILLRGNAWPRENEIEDLWEMSLEDLLATEVSVASKQVETVYETPGVISVLTAEDLKRLGVRNLVEAFTYLPGVTIMDVYWRGPIVTMRGIFQSLYNDKILLLINGIPAYESVNNSYFLELVPINAIKKIEVIRGPGSALYGTNAFAGVINIITLSAEDIKAPEFTLMGGSFGTVGAKLRLGIKNEDWDFFLAGSFTDDDGYRHPQTDELGNADTLNYENDVSSVLFSMKYKDLTVTQNYFHQVQDKFGMIPVFNFGGKAKHDQYQLGLQLKQTYGPVDANLYFRYNTMKRETVVGANAVTAARPLPGYTLPYDPDNIDGDPGNENIDVDESLYKGDLMGGGVQINYHGNSASVIGGFDYEKRIPDNLYTMLNGDGIIHDITGQLIGSGSINFPPPSFSEWGVYLQLSQKWSERWRFTGGARYSHLGTSGGHFTPRLGLVFTVSDTKSLKLLYGEAFRNPSAFERNLKVHEVLYGNNNLKPENIKTIEVAYDYHAQRTLLRVNAFYTLAADLIARRNLTAAEMASMGLTTGLTYDNTSATQKIHGLELEYERKLNPNLLINFNHSYNTSRNIMFEAKHTANLRLDYTTYAWNFYPSIQFVGKRVGSLSTTGAPVTVDPYALFHLTIEYHAGDNYSVLLSARNLFNENYQYPEYVRRQIGTLPGGPGVSFFLETRWKL